MLGLEHGGREYRSGGSGAELLGEQGPRPSTEWDVSGDVLSSRSGPHGWEVVLGSRGVSGACGGRDSSDGGYGVKRRVTSGRDVRVSAARGRATV